MDFESIFDLVIKYQRTELQTLLDETEPKARVQLGGSE
jgi:hypothetical protein